MDLSQHNPACDTGDRKLEAACRLIRERFGRIHDVLVVGCGDGTEAVLIGDMLGARVVGLDVSDAFHPHAAARVELVTGDARALPFADRSFDLVFSFHVLEHVATPERAVAEMARVLRADGGAWVGTPNRRRLVGYVGSRDASMREKLAWNVIDWRARITCRFRNELGAHAGFTAPELRTLLRSSFDRVEDETSAYYALHYPRQRRALAALDRGRISSVVYPAVYFSARRAAS